jgi:cyclic-di-GMP-binding biofilm dispersal mediator protein
VSDTKRVLVVGASGVLGKAVANHLEARGVHVVRASRSEVNKAYGHLQIDLRDWSSVRSCLENAGEIDGVINAAGVVAFGSIEDTPQDVVRELYETNTEGVSAVLKYSRKYLTEGGFVCNITGVAAEMDVIGMAAYCGSKSAASRIMRIARREFRSAKIRVVEARPGHTETGLASRSLYGSAPKMPAGLDPDAVASLLVSGVLDGLEEMGPEYFSAHAAQ